MNPTDGENEFEDFLARRATLLQRMADQHRTEPPAELDRIVLSKAREAIEPPPYQPMYRSPRWALPVALAATIVLSVAVGVNFYRVGHHAPAVIASMGAKESAKLTAAVAQPEAALAKQELAPASPPAERKAQVAADAISPPPLVAMSAASPPPPSPPAPAAHALAARAKRVDGQAWLRQIEQLRADGKILEANAQLEEYRKAFPRRAAPSAAAPVPPSR